jgi:hypothetical protein
MHVIFIGSNFFHHLLAPPWEMSEDSFLSLFFYPDKTQQNGIFKNHWKLLMFMRES